MGWLRPLRLHRRWLQGEADHTQYGALGKDQRVEGSEIGAIGTQEKGKEKGGKLLRTAKGDVDRFGSARASSNRTEPGQALERRHF